MKYIYETATWCDMNLDESMFREPLSQFYQTKGRLHGKLDALGFDVQNDLILNSVSDEVVASSEIEGEMLDKHSVRSSVAKRLGIDTAGLTDLPSNHYTENVVELVLDATQQCFSKVDDERLFSWHHALFPTGYSGLRKIVVGAYRLGDMSIISGPVGKEKVHYIAPASERVPDEMKRLLHWIEEKQNIDLYVKAGLAHLWFESIHPFDDGNGRIGRALSDLLLARAENNSKRFYSMSSQFLKERKAYYYELESAQNLRTDVERWICWFLACLTRAVESSETQLDIAIQKATFFEKIKNIEMNKRQVLIMNMLIDGFDGKLTTGKWSKLCKCSHDTALRDIEHLIKNKILIRSAAGGRSTSYELM